MKSVVSIFQKVLAKEFYRTNAGFFLLVVGICFGFLRGAEHIALAQYFISSPILLIVPVFTWLLYALKIILFNDAAMKKDANQFLYISATLPTLTLSTSLAMVSLQQLMPAILYGGFLAAMAYANNQLQVIPEVIIALTFFALLIIARLRWTILHINQEKKTGLIIHKLTTWFARPYVLFYPEWIVRAQPLMVFGTKVFASLIIIGVSRLYDFDTYDERLFDMGCMLAFSFNLLLVFYYQRFENFHFSMMRSLPIALPQRLINFIFIFIILQMAEIGSMINYLPSGVTVFHTIFLILFGLSIDLMFYAGMHFRDRTMESFVNRLFFMTIAWIVLILFQVPIVLMAVVQIVLATMIYRKYFYRFEFDAEINSEK